MEIVEPLADVESEISIVSREVENSGKVVFILGRPGTGKSTFIHSLSWRPYVRIRQLIQLNAGELGTLRALLQAIRNVAPEAVAKRDGGPTAVVVNYLEDLADYDEAQVKGFFRDLNGILRNAPILVIWPVTEPDDVKQMLQVSASLSGTLFCRGREIINFSGPSVEKFVDITKRTISVLNAGMELSDFSLTNDDLEEVLRELKRLPVVQRTIREYIELTKAHWRKSSDYEARLKSGVPKPNEVWFVFSYKDAESAVSQFVRKSHRVDDAWSAIHDKIYEYIHENNRRSAIWDPQRLQMALYGVLKTRIMYLPTNTLVSCVASHATNRNIIELMEKSGLPQGWKKKNKAKSSLRNTPLYRQIVGDSHPVGKRKGGPAAEAMKQASPIFADMVKWISSGGGSDREINKALASALADATNFPMTSDQPHPWIPSIIPDVFLDLPHAQICIEFHHTNRDEPNVVADYVLSKLNSYMDQINALINRERAEAL